MSRRSRLPIVLSMVSLAAASLGGCAGGNNDDPPAGGDHVAGGDPGGGDVGPLPFGVHLTSPAAGAEDVPADSPVVIVFTQAPKTSTLLTQALWGACAAANTVSVSADGFVNCAGGTLSFPSDTMTTFTATHGLLNANRTYQVRVSDSVTDANDVPLAQTYTLAPGFTVGVSACHANDPVDHTTTGAACVAPSFIDNGDGTITDRANKLLWTRCSVGGGGALLNGVGFACELPIPANDWMNWEDASTACEDLEHAGRSDWKLPDLAELLTLLAESGDPAIDTTFFPQTANMHYGASTTYVNNLDTHWSVLFGFSGFTGPGYGGKHRPGGAGALHVRCVAGHLEAPAPMLTNLRVYYATASEAALFTPNFLTALGSWPTKQGYIGVDGSIGASGTVVVNALQGPIDLTAAADTADFYVFGGLSAGTTYRIIVTAENAAGESVKEIVVSTDPVAPILAPLEISDFTDTSLFLAPPSFTRAGTPNPTVEAWIGLEGTITATDEVVTNALQGPYDVSSVGHDFIALDTNQNYGIFVVATNSAGYSRGFASQHLGRWSNNLNGTVTDTRTGLTWFKCLAGQSWASGTDSCAGTPSKLQFCSEIDNDCNGGIETGILGPPWLNENGCGAPLCDSPGYSTAWNECDGQRQQEFGGRGGWRIPTVDELLSLESDGDCLDETAFPNVPTGDDGRIVSAESSSMFWFNAVDASCEVRFASGKDDNFWVRCVSSE